jgi:uncharacterized RDD family membrane protein YckC
MSTMPEGDAAGQQGGTPHGTHPGAPQQPGVPGPEQYGGAQYSGAPYGTVPAQPHGQEPGGYPGNQPGRTAPVTKPDTRVTGRRVVQYLIDSFLVGIIPALAAVPFARSGSTFVHVLGGIVAFGVFVLVGLLYWVVFTHAQHGQTLGMKLLGLRVISMDGGPANRAQLTIRWLGLILDAIPYTWPFTGLLGFIVILCSRNRQRIGDHLARTLVIATDRTEPSQPPAEPSQPPAEPR